MKKAYRLLFSVLLVIANFAYAVPGQPDTQGGHIREARNGIYVIAHRGVHTGIPENSLPAYAKAIELGCDFVEIDVRRTKDGHFVSIHNPKIDAYVVGKTGLVRDMTLEQLKALDIGSRIGPEWKGTRIPTFEEILALAKGKIGIYLDLKVAALPELVKILKEYGMERDVIWYIPSDFYIKSGAKAFGNSYPMPDPGSFKNLGNFLDNYTVDIVATDMGTLTPDFVTRAHAGNTKVFVDEDEGSESEWNKILYWQTDGIQTDHPEKLILFLEKRNSKALSSHGT